MLFNQMKSGNNMALFM